MCFSAFCKGLPENGRSGCRSPTEELFSASSPAVEITWVFVLNAALLAVFLAALDALILGAARPTIVALMNALIRNDT
jgi:hypothetical protein